MSTPFEPAASTSSYDDRHRRNTSRRAQKDALKRKQRRSFVPWFHGLDRRLMRTTFVVIDASDSGPGSLHRVILDSNAAGGQNIIRLQHRFGRSVSTIGLTIPAAPLFANARPRQVEPRSRSGMIGYCPIDRVFCLLSHWPLASLRFGKSERGPQCQSPRSCCWSGWVNRRVLVRARALTRPHSCASSVRRDSPTVRRPPSRSSDWAPRLARAPRCPRIARHGNQDARSHLLVKIETALLTQPTYVRLDYEGNDARRPGTVAQPPNRLQGRALSAKPAQVEKSARHASSPRASSLLDCHR